MMILGRSLIDSTVSQSVRWNGMELKMAKELVGHGSQMSKVTLTLGDMVQEAEAIGVKQATQYASQLLFKQMHPEITTYGSFLELNEIFEDKAKKQHDEVVRLQDTGNLLQPNFIVLSRLAEEMKAMTLVHPPHKFLFGLAPDATGTVASTTSTSTQYKVEDTTPQLAAPYPLNIPPMNFPAMRVPPFLPPHQPHQTSENPSQKRKT